MVAFTVVQAKQQLPPSNFVLYRPLFKCKNFHINRRRNEQNNYNISFYPLFYFWLR